ncbi:hypothetical protein ASE19_18285 [Nocardioides sp. Root79]|nr:hypothetical protein ASE19_18285 [Nocardioides sp. Root79]KRC75266.1 hypothetical protein ASE20_20185 [Nocardioides sp. Root240]
MTGMTRTISARARLALGALVVALGALAGTAWASYAGREHVATATILLHPLEGNAYSPGGRGDDLVNLETEAQVLRSDAVARAVLRRLGSSGTPARLLASVSVVVPPNTQLLEISVRAGDDATAAERASAFGDVYLAFRKSRTESSIFGRTSRLEELVGVREGERKAALGRLERLSSTAPERRLLEQQVQEIVVQIGSLRAQLATAQAIGLDPGQVVTPGHVVAAGPTSDPRTMALVGGGAALLAGLAVAVVRSGRRTVTLVGDAAAVAECGLLPLGAVAPPVGADDAVIARARSVVLAVGPDRPLVVTVAPVTAGVPTTFDALVGAFANARYEVVAIDLARLPDRVALAELVLQRASVSDVLVQVGEFRSHLRPLDDLSDDAGFADLVASAQMRHCLEDLAKRADLVLVGAPPLRSPVGRALLAASRAVVVEAQTSVVTRPDLTELVEEAARLDGTIAGVVLVGVPGASSEVTV